MKKPHLGVFAVLLGFIGNAHAQTPPPNDNFAERTVLTGSSLTATGSLAGATFESVQTNSTPPFSSGPQTGGSVWWTWAAPQSSAVVIQVLLDYTIPIQGYTELAVYSGTNLNALTLEAQN